MRSGEQLSCEACYADTMRIQRASLTWAARCLMEAAFAHPSGGANILAFPAGFALCSTVPACESLACEPPICRDVQSQDRAIPHVKEIFREGLMGDPELKVELLRGALSWAKVEAPIHRHARLKVGDLSFHAVLIANNLLSLVRPAAESSPGVVPGSLLAACQVSMDEVEQHIRPLAGEDAGRATLEAGDLICLHLICRAMKDVRFVTHGKGNSENNSLASDLLRRLQQHDFIGQVAKAILYPEGGSAVFGNLACLAGVLRQVRRSPGGEMIITRLGRDLGQEIKEITRVFGERQPKRADFDGPNPSILRLVELCQRLMDEDGRPDYAGTLIATHFLTEILYLRPRPDSRSQVQPGTRDIEPPNPLWEIMAAERSIASGIESSDGSEPCAQSKDDFNLGMPSLLARFTQFVALIATDRHRPSNSRLNMIVERFFTAARVLVEQPRSNASSWQLFVVRYLRQIFSQPQAGLRFPPDSGMTLMGLCQLIEGIAAADIKREQPELGGLLLEECRSVMSMPDFIHTPSLPEQDEPESLKREIEINFGSGSGSRAFLDEYLRGLIGSGRILSRADRVARANDPGSAGPIEGAPQEVSSQAGGKQPAGPGRPAEKKEERKPRSRRSKRRDF